MKKFAILLSLALLFSGRTDGQSINKSLTDGLLIHYPFNGTTLDESGNGYHAVNYGAMLTADRFGNPNSAFVFNGINNYMEIPGTESFNFATGGFSVCAWVNFTNSSQNKPIIAKHISGIQSGWFLAVRPEEKIQFYLTGEPGLSTIQSYNDGNWHFAVAVFDGSTMYLYMDGLLKVTQPRNHSNYNSATLKLGYLDGGGGDHFFDGKMDDIRIYNRVLSPEEVVQLNCNECLLADIRVFLEGPFNGTGMNTDLNTAGYIPLNQPFSGSPWNYMGGENVSTIPPGVVDWVLLEPPLRTPALAER